VLSLLKQARRAFYREIVRKDCYLMKNYRNDYFDHILDIGANVGVFTLFANFRHPKANIIAYEPCVETFAYLIDNTGYIDNVEYVNEALGDGEPLYLHDTGYSGCNLFYKENETTNLIETVPTKSVSLYDMLKDKIIFDSKYFIKIDCEGGERFLLYDLNSIDVIRRSAHTAIEVHFPPSGASIRKGAVERFKSFPSWEIYNNWMNDNFKNTHDIIYHCSDKRTGSGVYVLHGKHR